MSKFFDALDDKLSVFIAEQPIFFVASAPHEGQINLSPKGGDCFRVINHNLACYLDLTGSGNETAAHIADDGRLTIMFNSFSKTPLILRLYGRGHTALKGSDDWGAHIGKFPEIPGARQLVFITIDQVQTSCGFAVPQMELVAPRDTLTRWAENKGPDGLKDYRAVNNITSIDGLPTGFVET